MSAPIFKSKNAERVAGLLIGIGFGFLLQRSGVTQYDNLVGQLLLQEWVVVKVMLSAVIVGMVGMRFAVPPENMPDPKKRPSLGSTIAGGLVFGAGFAILGYCPGTNAGALGQGQMDALVGAFGMMFGGWLYALAYPWLQQAVLGKGSFGSSTIHGFFGWSDPWRAISLVIICTLLIFLILEIAGA